MSTAVLFEETVLAGLETLRAVPAGGGHGGRLLFVHGMFGSLWVWQRYLGYFASRGWEGWAVSLRGHGRRAVEGSGRLRLADDVRDVAMAATALGGPALVGHSLGGLLALKAAEQAPAAAVIALTPAPPRGLFSLRTLTLLGAAACYVPGMLRGSLVRPRARLLRRVALHRLDAAERERAWRRLVPESGRRVLGVVLGGVRVHPERVRCPRLVVAAGADRLTPPGMVRRIADRYQAACYEYAALSHMVLLEDDWRLVAADLADWLDAVRGRRAPATVSA